jgi:hypothetical protein
MTEHAFVIDAKDMRRIFVSAKGVFLIVRSHLVGDS